MPAINANVIRGLFLHVQKNFTRKFIIIQKFLYTKISRSTVYRVSRYIHVVLIYNPVALVMMHQTNMKIHTHEEHMDNILLRIHTHRSLVY